MLCVFKFLRLSFSEKKLFVFALYLLSLYCLRLKTYSFQSLLETVREVDSCKKRCLLPISVHQITRIIQAASRFVPGKTCLSNALAGKIVFFRCGYITHIHIGVTKEEDRVLKAHAWLTLNDTIVLGYVPDLENFVELPLPDLIGDFKVI